MPTTTIKVDTDVRDQLSALARARGQTMGNLLAEVAARLAEEDRLRQIATAYADLATRDPAEWQTYLDELAAWDNAIGSDDTAASEWPEYNSPPAGPDR